MLAHTHSRSRPFDFVNVELTQTCAFAFAQVRSQASTCALSGRHYLLARSGMHGARCEST
eukprot:6207006-Pleurochrysis_carterae.AAC.3